MEKKIIFMRHSCTDYHEQKRVIGITDKELNQKGITMVYNCLDILEKHRIDVIVTSNLKRAYQTGRIISEELNIPLFVEEDISERDQGILEGMTFEEVADLFGEVNGITKIAGREELKQFIRRVSCAITRICDLFDEKNILIVAHSNVLQTFFQIHGVRVRKWELCDMKEGIYYGDGRWYFED